MLYLPFGCSSCLPMGPSAFPFGELFETSPPHVLGRTLFGPPEDDEEVQEELELKMQAFRCETRREPLGRAPPGCAAGIAVVTCEQKMGSSGSSAPQLAGRLAGLT